MKYGVREICEVVMRAKARMQVGNKVFYKDEPVIYFDTLTTSSLEGASTTVYANGGRGNARLMSWDGERTLTFTMEDALISAEGLMILSGAGLIENDIDLLNSASSAERDKKLLKQHIVETISKDDLMTPSGQVLNAQNYNASAGFAFDLSNVPYMQDDGENYMYVMFMRDGEIVSEPFIPSNDDVLGSEGGSAVNSGHIFGQGKVRVVLDDHLCNYHDTEIGQSNAYVYEAELPEYADFDAILVDYYTCRERIKQIEITADSFGGNFYLEASTLFRGTNGVDYPAEFIIPNCRIQSNFTFSMASTGDPSTFTFTLDAFPDYTRWDKSKKVLAAIQIIEDAGAGVGGSDYHRGSTSARNGNFDSKADSMIHEDDHKYPDLENTYEANANITYRGKN